MTARKLRYASICSGIEAVTVAWLGERILRVLAMLERGEEIPTEMA